MTKANETLTGANAEAQFEPRSEYVEQHGRALNDFYPGEFNPITDTHLAIGPEGEVALDSVIRGAEAMGQILRTMHEEGASEPSSHVVAAMFETVALAIKGATSDSWNVFPKHKMVKRRT